MSPNVKGQSETLSMSQKDSCSIKKRAEGDLKVSFTLDRIFQPRRTPSKKRDSDGLSASSGASRGSEKNKASSTFSLSRLLPSRRRSKSRLSLDSEPSRSDGGACGTQVSPPHSTGNVRSSPTPPSASISQTIPSVHLQCSNNAQSETCFTLESIPLEKIVLEEVSTDSAIGECGISSQGEEKGVVLVECPVCLVEKSKDFFFEFSTCHHRCCSSCLREYFRIEIMESRLAIACPECSELFHPNDIRAVVQDDVLMQKYEDFMLRRVLAMDSDTRWCPAPDCGYAVIAYGCAGCPKLKCERDGCDTYFCYHCKQYWHPNQTCDAARAERSPNNRSSSVSYSQESGAQNEIKSCPRCGAFIVKMDDGSCNHMTCAVCGAGFCWLCMKEISDLHYLSPSGCTFWGRKPWSRKKKILWQLGTLVGAPVGITLVAGIAVPAMIIGIPVWVGRKIHYRFEGTSKHKRNLAITGGVAASILAAPIIAGLAVGIGVPILLAYVYGVVPFSLCRSGGCGVTTTNTGGVRFEFDEHDENNTHGPYSTAGDNHSIETAPNVANPSIATSIGETSLGMTNSLSASGSHIDRAGILRDDSDRDSSSHRAIAGNSINGSLCSATYGAQHHKLEVHADISEHSAHCERSSVGGESYSMSLNDDASTRALAGSIVSPKDKDGISLCSRHFDGASGPLAYPEESSLKDDECASSSGGGGQHQRGSSSCPTSPHLRKASPAPSEDTHSTRGKKCTRFMDQVSEIESKSDCLSIGSIISTNSGSPCYDGISPTLPTYSTLSLTTVTTTQAALASCESLMSAGKAETIGAADICKTTNMVSGGVRVKAESTSVLMDGADSRRCEMGGARRKSDSTSRDDMNPSERLLASRKKSGTGYEKEHRSQPGNLSDISELKGMPSLHTAGCPDLLAVIPTRCENVFLDKKGQTKARLISLSSFSSSLGESSEFSSRRSIVGGFGNCETVRETVVYSGSMLDVGDSLSEVNSSQVSLEEGNVVRASSRSVLPVSTSAHDRHAFLVTGGLNTSQNLHNTTTASIYLLDDRNSDADQANGHLLLCKRDSSLSHTSIGSDCAMAASPLPDVEMPTYLPDTVGAAASSPKSSEVACCHVSFHSPVNSLSRHKAVKINMAPLYKPFSEPHTHRSTDTYSPDSCPYTCAHFTPTETNKNLAQDQVTLPLISSISEPHLSHHSPSFLPCRGTKDGGYPSSVPAEPQQVKTNEVLSTHTQQSLRSRLNLLEGQGQLETVKVECLYTDV